MAVSTAKKLDSGKAGTLSAVSDTKTSTKKKTTVSKPNNVGQYTNLSGISTAAKKNLNYYGQGYQKSKEVQNAQKYLEQVMKQKPGKFKSDYDKQIKTLYNQIMNRPAFEYDVNTDPLYEQYKHQYTTLGQQAMQDTVGNAAALTGGYGNSWAETAGNQAYQEYLQQLNNVVPQLYDSAYARYTQEGDELRNNLAMTQGLRDTDYGMYRDTVADWQKDRDYAQGAYDSAYNRDYANWSTMLSYWQQQAQLENSDYWVRKQNEKKKGSGGGGGRKKNTGLQEGGQVGKYGGTGKTDWMPKGTGETEATLAMGDAIWFAQGGLDRVDTSTKEGKERYEQLKKRQDELVRKGYLTSGNSGSGGGNGNGSGDTASSKANATREEYGKK